MATSTASFLEIPTLPVDIAQRKDPSGFLYLQSNIPLEAGPEVTTERLQHWAREIPNTVFLAQRTPGGIWQTLTYQQTWEQVQHLGQFLLNAGLSEARPLAILSGNSLEHGVLALAAMHVGIPYAPISPAYCLRSAKFEKLTHCIDLLTPGLVFAAHGKFFGPALATLPSDIGVMTLTQVPEGACAFENALQTPVTDAVAKAHAQLHAGTIAKILFTSGSTGLPKGVINTHGNITTNWKQITQIFPFFKNGGLQLMDWLPWNHTFGGNHNFGLTLFNGGTLYIDAGNPTAEGIQTTVNNLKDLAPTVYFNVPKGFEELIPYLKKDEAFRTHFFSRLKMFFYAGANMSQKVWDDLEALAVQATGKKLLISSGLGMTEASPSAMFNTHLGSKPGALGVPVPGITLKLVPDGDKLEARFKGNNLTPGYWRNPEATAAAFDEEGYYKTGDAIQFLDPSNPNTGMWFDGRIAEDFKLSSGTWVNVGVLRAKLIAHGDGVVRDAVITGHDRDYLGAILIPEINRCRELLSGTPSANLPLEELVLAPEMQDFLQQHLDAWAQTSTGSSTKIKRALFAGFELNIDLGEITDKGSINQRMFLAHRKAWVDRLYTNPLTSGILETNH
ncbi:MAG: hypothetical protein RLZZ241_2116 [Bacteroidota bacterium]